MTALALTIALRSLGRRKIRSAMIGLLVFLGTLLIVLGDTFSLSVSRASRQSIINYFTGDIIIYSGRSKENRRLFHLPRLCLRWKILRESKTGLRTIRS